MKLLSYVLEKSLALKARMFEWATRDPVKAQKNVLLEFISRNRDTAYGRKHFFKDINSIEHYQERIPINNYETLYPYIQRLIQGEINILTKDKPVLFGTTSGTTGAPKFIPVTEYSRRRKADVMNLWVYYIIRDYPDLFNGKILAIVSPEIENCTERGLPCGAETGHAYKNLPFILKSFYALPYPVFEIRDYEAKYYTILRLSIEKNITSIATMNPSTVVLLCQKIDDFKEAIIDDIERGTLRRDLNIRENIRKVIEKGLRPNPRRAALLKELLRKRGSLLPLDFWPHLKLIECWKGGTVGLYLKEFPKYFGGVPVRDFGYLSSEARCSVPTDNHRRCGTLAINANFYEFVPKEEKHKKSKKTLLCDQLDVGGEYFVVITTPGGLYRYDIDDVIKVTGFHNKTPRIEFMQKGLNVTSITGEKLYESQVVEAVNRSVERCEVVLEFFTACIQWDRTPRYVFLVEFKDAPRRDNKRELLRCIDDEIKAINMEYMGKRKSMRLDNPILKVVKRGAFHNYRVKRVENGAHDGQFKVPQLTKDLDFQSNFDIEEEIHIKR